jgi:DHA3 family macrolide efflux protein-like MFS transporter
VPARADPVVGGSVPVTAANAAAGRAPSALTVFRSRNFRFLWTAQLISTIGSSLTDLAAGILVYRLTGSAAAVGLMLMATAVPSLIVGLIAGVFVDRFDRKRIMIASNLLQAALVASIPFFIGINAALLYVIVLMNAGVKQFFDPAHEAVIPEVASDEELAAANSFLSIADFGSTAIGFAAAGLIASQFPIEWAFWLDALTFLVSAACISFVHIVHTKGEELTSVRAVVGNLRSGIATLTGTPVLRSILLTGIPVFFAFGLWNVLLLPFSIKELGATEFEYGLQEGLTSVGFVVGALMMARFADRLRPGAWIVMSLFGMGAVGILYGLSNTVWVAIILVTISGFLNAPSSIARRTLLQRSTPREMRGRVFSAMFVSRDVIFLLGIGAAGLADVIDIRVMIIASSVVIIVAGLATAVAPGIGRPAAQWRRALRRLEEAEAVPAAPAAARAASLSDFDRLVGRLPTFSRLSPEQRDAFVGAATVSEVPEGTRVVTRGDLATSAYFILDGQVAVGIRDETGYHGLATLVPGDFFGEIAALTGSPRTADVVADAPATFMEVPAEALRDVMVVPEINRLVLSALTERLVRTNLADLPRISSGDQSALRELRTTVPRAEALPKRYAETGS